MCRPRTPAYARRWHKMGDKCIPAAPNQLLTGILASIMQSSCLFQAQSCGQCGMRAPLQGCAASPSGEVNFLDFSRQKLNFCGRILFFDAVFESGRGVSQSERDVLAVLVPADGRMRSVYPGNGVLASPCTFLMHTRFCAALVLAVLDQCDAT